MIARIWCRSLELSGSQSSWIALLHVQWETTSLFLCLPYRHVQRRRIRRRWRRGGKRGGGAGAEAGTVGRRFMLPAWMHLQNPGGLNRKETVFIILYLVQLCWNPWGGGSQMCLFHRTAWYHIRNTCFFYAKFKSFKVTCPQPITSHPSPPMTGHFLDAQGTPLTLHMHGDHRAFLLRARKRVPVHRCPCSLGVP